MTNYHVENELRETAHRLYMTMITMRGLSRKMLSAYSHNSKLDAVIVYSENLRSVHAMTLDILEDLLVGEFDMYLEKYSPTRAIDFEEED